jgi:putative ABC transport system substrate-binding protein
MRRREFIVGLGGAAAWPLAARAQQASKVPRIGFLGTPRFNSPDARLSREALLQELRSLGYVAGQNIIIEYRTADGRIERLPELADDLVRMKVDLILAGATPAGRAAQQATKTIPIVVSAMGDPVQDGLVASLAHPGGNITGNTFLGPELVPKRVALLRELVPGISRLAVLRHPGVFGEATMQEMLTGFTSAAVTLSLQFQFFDVDAPDDIEGAFAKMGDVRADALFQFPSTMLFGERRRIVELAERYRLPAMFNAREFVQLGGLAAYGANIDELFRRSAFYADKILKGAKPSDLPVEQPTKFEFALNLKTAKALGVAVPPMLLARADEVIE